MTVGIRNVVEWPDLDHSKLIPEGHWLESYDPEANDGLGAATWTSDPSKALKFVDLAAAIRVYHSSPSNRPTRVGWDDLPNRPLTMYSISIETLKEEP